MNKFNMGETVYCASFDMTEDTIQCPHCGGTGRVRIIFHDETENSIECGNCQNYDHWERRPTGRVKIHHRVAKAEKRVICGISIENNGKVEYRASTGRNGSFWILKEDIMFKTEQEAMEAAEKMAIEYDENEKNEVLKKYRDDRSWAWNASYHRKRVADAKRDLEYHTAKLNVADLKKKEK